MLLYPYKPSWADDYKAIVTEIYKKIDCQDIAFHHIGSTSIIGLAAKAIIDIDISYDKLSSFLVIKKGLERIGYRHAGDQGIRGREVFKRITRNEVHPTLDSIDHHLYFCHAENEEFKRHLKFRDHLRNNPHARNQYEALKHRIAILAHQNKKEYALLKETKARDFIEEILRR